MVQRALDPVCGVPKPYLAAHAGVRVPSYRLAANPAVVGVPSGRSGHPVVLPRSVAVVIHTNASSVSTSTSSPNSEERKMVGADEMSELDFAERWGW